MNRKCETEYDAFVALIDKIIPVDEKLEDEFEDLEGDDIRTFRTEYAHESLTEHGSRYKTNKVEG